MKRQSSSTKSHVHGTTANRRHHRLKAARVEAGISRRDVAQRMNVALSTVRDEEEGDDDLSLVNLHRWQLALNVPLSELVESAENQLPEPTRQRAAMVRLARTAALLQQNSKQVTNRRLACRMLDQLHELMPELRNLDVTPGGAAQVNQEKPQAAGHHEATRKYSWLHASDADCLLRTLQAG